MKIYTKTDVSNDSSTVMFDMNAGSADIDLLKKAKFMIILCKIRYKTVIIKRGT